MGKRNTTFRFKQFTIDHSKASMKVGTDGVLLGAWADVTGVSRVLDIGTGSGVIALMIAQRTEDHVLIDGVDIGEADIEQARANAESSPWRHRLQMFCTPVQKWNPPLRYDLIISNPPYFINSFEPTDENRARSRHTATLSYAELLHAAGRLLEAAGRLAVILPAVEGTAFIKMAEPLGFTCSRLYAFRPRRTKPVERWLIEFSRGSGDITKGEIVMYEAGTEWTDGYKNLTREFYLKI